MKGKQCSQENNILRSRGSPISEQPEIFRKMKDILKLAAYMASIQCNCKAEGK